MKLGNVKTTIATSVFGLVTLFGMSDAVNAQSRNRGDNFPSPVYNQRIELEKQRQREEQIRFEQQRQEQIRLEQIRIQNQNNQYGYGKNLRFKVYQNGKVFITDYRGLETLKKAVINGYEKGFQMGQAERKNRRKGGFYMPIGYRNSNYGNYGNFGHQNHIDSRLLQFYFQKGVEEGFEDGFNTRRMRGWERDDVKISQYDLRSILKFERF